MDVTFTCVCHYQGMVPAPNVFVALSNPGSAPTFLWKETFPECGLQVNLLVGSLRKSASGVNREMTREAGLQGVSRPFALESCGEPGHALTGTSRDPRLFWGTVSRQEAGTCEKGICQSEAEQSVQSDRAWLCARTQTLGRDSHGVPGVMLSLPAD